MRIAQIAPVYESVPPQRYGGTERVIAFLVDELVDLGHEVTLFASGESRTKAKLVNCRDQAIWTDRSRLSSDNAAHLSLLHEVGQRAHEFDILHFHIDLLPFPLFEHLAPRTVTTLHGRLDIADLQDFFRCWRDYPLVSISENQRTPLNFVNWAGTVYHGLPPKLLRPVASPSGGYLAFLGRICPEKRPDVAIKLACRAGREIRLAAKVQPTDASYFHDRIESLLEYPNVKYIGEIGDAEKADFLGNADAMLFPIGWPEPFGIAMIEALACGTPVIAWNCGSVPEVIEDGVTGFVVNNDEEALEALQRVGELDRGRIRAEFERRFSARQMAQGYEDLYRKLLNQQPEAATSASPKSVSSASKATASGSFDTAHDAPPQQEKHNVEDAVSVESEEGTMPYNLYAIKHRDSFAIANGLGDIVGKGDGFFRDDTRVLSDYHLSFGGKPLSLLSAAISQDDVYFKTQLTNRPLPQLGQRSIPEGIIHIERARFLWDERLYERLRLTNYGEHELKAPIDLAFAADFRDIFEVRGMKRKERGQNKETVVKDDHVVLAYRGLDDRLRQSVIAFSEQPENLTEGAAHFHFTLPKKTTLELYIEVGPDYQGAPGRDRFRASVMLARRATRRRRHSGATVRSSDQVFDMWLQRSRSDLALLTTQLETGPYPYAGIPWFSTPFGRDAIITALQLLWLDPQIARGVLAFLAHTQAQENSSFRDSAPGKIMHETRKGEMSQLGEVPFKLYYGGVDSTPLFVTLAGAYAERTGDLAFIDTIWPALDAAMAWVKSSAETSRDGFLSYKSAESTGLRNQGWKDSDDSVFHTTGEYPDGPISLVEVQGYQFAAMAAMARLAGWRGDIEGSKRWSAQADTVRSSVERRFWMEDKNFYALAIDGADRLCRVRASNAGHLLFSGLPGKERAAKVTEQLLSTAFNSGWGIRTVASDEIHYNPMSYHNGSIWPHDTAICAAGMARYGDRSAAAHILSELFNAAVSFDMRLPELFCGFQHATGEGPIAYPVACLPQSWSSGSGLMALQACLGIHIDGMKQEVVIQRPELPGSIDRVMLKGLLVGGARVNLVFQRVGERITVSTRGHSHEIDGISVRTLL